LPLYQPERERELLENAYHNNVGPLTRRIRPFVLAHHRRSAFPERIAMHKDLTKADAKGGSRDS